MDISTQTGVTSPQGRSLNMLRRFAARREVVERCELCAARLPGGHDHLLEPVQRKVVCACGACAMLFSPGGETKYKRVPRRHRFLPNFRLTDAQWDSLMIPINMAFFFESTPDKRTVVLYPSPAGPIESLLPVEAWSDVVQENPILQQMESDVEALLVNRIGHARGMGAADYFLLPIDDCYKLVGLVRSGWRGLSGGAEVWRSVGSFFDEVKGKACLT